LPEELLEKNNVEKTYVPKAKEISREWILVDADDQNLGRLASRIAHVLLGKHKPGYMPGVDTGDYVVVVNCERVRVTGKKMEVKMYYRHSQYPGGLKEINLRKQLDTHPDRVLRAAVWGMLPKNKLSRQLIRKLKIYAGPTHPHQAQEPKQLVLN
jgi:large subunit ribosomal protein L13